MVLMDEDHRSFLKKTGTIFPGEEPPLFFGRNAPPDLPEVPDNLADQPVFHAQRNAAKLHGFFPIKTLGFKKYQIKRIIVERIGATSTGTSRTRIRPDTSFVGETIMEYRGSGHTPFIKGRPPEKGAVQSVLDEDFSRALFYNRIQESLQAVCSCPDRNGRERGLKIHMRIRMITGTNRYASIEYWEDIRESAIPTHAAIMMMIRSSAKSSARLG
jgi:hypothetical protein